MGRKVKDAGFLSAYYGTGVVLGSLQSNPQVNPRNSYRYLHFTEKKLKLSYFRKCVQVRRPAMAGRACI